MYTVYKTTNLINGKWYIGVHRTENPMDSYLGSGYLLARAIARYGRTNFKKEILCSFDDAELAYFVESHYVTQREIADDQCYNIKQGGRGGAKFGHVVSDDTKKKISEKNKGKPKSEEAREKMRNRSRESIEFVRQINLGAKRSDSSKEKMRIAQTGKKQSPETIAKRIAKTKGKKRTPEQLVKWDTRELQQ